MFVAGQAPINAATQKMELGDIRSETRLELTNISKILKASSSSLENVVKVSIHLADLNDFDAMNEVYREFFHGDYPARATVEQCCAAAGKSKSTVSPAKTSSIGPNGCYL